MFEPAVVNELPGPGWLRARRAAAAEGLTDASLPSTDEEVWRYSRIAELDTDDFAPLTSPPSTETPPAAAAVIGAVPDRAGLVVVRNGFVVRTELDEALAAKGVRLAPMAELDDGEELLEHAQRQLPHDAFSTASRALAAEPIALVVPEGLAIDRPFVVIDWVDADGAAAFPVVHISAGAASDVQVLEWHGSDDVHALVAPTTNLTVGQAARLGHVLVQDRGARIWQIANQTADVGQQATLASAQAGLGGDYARSRVDCRLTGRGATGDLLAVYFGQDDQMLDFRTFQDHLAPDTTSNLLFKGAVSGTSQSVYTGLIHVAKEARGTHAFQTNRNIKLSDGAWAESVPNLEIENNDVRCSHASTVGPVDEEQRFYLESRGVPTAVAERLIVGGFFDEVLAQLPVAAVRPLLELEIDRRLERSAES